MRRLLPLLVLLVFPVCAAAQADSTHGLPPIPETAPTVIGPIVVHRVPNLLCNGKPALGCFKGDTRYLAVRDSLPLVVAYQTLFHELAHANFYYGAFSFGTKDAEDKVADAIANERVMELLARWP